MSRVDAVERDAAVVADDPAAAVGVGQSGEDVRAAASPDVGRVGVEDRVVVRLAVLGECLDDVRIGLVAVRLERVGDHPEAAVRHDRALQRRVGLQTDDDLVLAVDVAGRVGGDGAGNLRDVEHALLPLLDEQLVERLPDLLRARGGGREERFVAVVRLVVLLDEVANVDLLLPETGSESRPGATSSAQPSFPAVAGVVMDYSFTLWPRAVPLRAGFDKPSSSPVCRAIISSSLVGITQADTLLPAVEIRGPLREVGRVVQFDAEPRGGLADAPPDLRGVLADAGGEHQSVDSAQHRRERADFLGGAVHEVVHRQAGAGLGAAPAGRACRC